MGDDDPAADLTTSGSAELDLLLKAVGAERGQAVVEYLDHKRRQHATRGEWFLGGADLTVDQAVRAATADPRIDEVFQRGVAASLATTDRDKVELLGKVFRRCMGATDDAELDSERVMLDTIAGLDAPHMRLLAVWWSIKARLTLRTAAGRAQLDEEVADALVAHLVRAGLLQDVTAAEQRRRDTEAAKDRGRGVVPPMWALTRFGGKVALFLEEELPAADA